MNEITMEMARRDDCLDMMVPSDLRKIIGERDRLRLEMEQERAQMFWLGIRRATVCLGCGKRVEADCGCPAGTREEFRNIRAEEAEERVRQLEIELRRTDDEL